MDLFDALNDKSLSEESTAAAREMAANAIREAEETIRRMDDELLARMQTPEARAGMMAAFHATPEELGKAAVEGARRGRA